MKKLAILIFAAFISQILSARDLPAPPTGFTWQEIPELKAAFLKPEGWFFKREVHEGTLAYFITREDIGKNGQFQTGLTANVFRLRKDSAVERGKGLIEQIAGAHHAEIWDHKAGPFQEFACMIKDTDATGTIVMYALAVANPKTNTLYYFTFESPESDWGANWKTGKQIMDTLALADGA